MMNKLFVVMTLGLTLVATAEPLVIEWNGDMRYRNELTAKQGDSNKRYRQRVKAKLGLEATKGDGWAAGLELATGSSDPVSNNMTLGDDFSTANFGLNLIYINFQNSWLDVKMGKFKNPLTKVQKNELLWDGDLNPEGANAALSFGDKAKLTLSSGAYWLQERSKDDETWIHASQVVFTHDKADYSYTLTAAYTDYHNIQAQAFVAGENAGNKALGDTYANDFNLLDFGLACKMKLAGIPFELAGAYAQNLDVSKENTAFYVGLTVGKAKAENTWQGSVSYRQLESESVLGAFADSDFNGGGTQGQGFEVNFKYQVSDEVSIVATQFLTQTIDKKKSGRSLSQLDLNYKF